MDTQLYVIKRDFQTMTDKAKGKIVTPADGAATTSTIFCSYLLAVFLSFFGFFAGIYLLFKKQPGHGIIVIVLSILAGLFWFLVMAGSALR